MLGDAERLFQEYFAHIQGFVGEALCADQIEDDLYIAGTTRIEYYAPRLRKQHAIDIDEHVPSVHRKRQFEFEEALVERLLTTRPVNLLVLLGGLGAGKTTTIRYVLHRLAERAHEPPLASTCPFPHCRRRPIHLELRWLRQEHVRSADEVLLAILRDLRLALYPMLLNEWLTRSGNNASLIANSDPDFQVLRRLLIANDLRAKHSGEYSGMSELQNEPLSLEQPLLRQIFSDSDLVSLITSRRSAAQAFDAQLQQTLTSPIPSKELTIAALRVSADHCAQTNPLHLIIVDNLDQLPTAYITRIVDEIHEIATRIPHLPLLVPLRPSSLGLSGFVRDINYRYHYGPNNFEMIQSRLERLVLTKARADLRTKGVVFDTEPTETEIDALLTASYTYASIMSAGAVSHHTARRAVRKHPDHAPLLDMVSIGEGALFSLAETADALVGACCRYGLDLLRRTMGNLYDSSTFVQRALSLTQYREQSLGKSVRISYGDLALNLLKSNSHGGEQAAVANLFAPHQSTTNDWPTLAKLRILSLLTREKRTRVREVIHRLSLFGIPTEVAIGSLNALNDKFRLLLWFSTNEDLRLDDPRAFDHDVVISEHGERYFKRIVGDFEYLWFCANRLQRSFSDTNESIPFPVKLGGYKKMLTQLGLTEWKQISFNKFRRNSPDDITTVSQASRLHTLGVLYSSLGRALTSTELAIRHHRESILMIDDLIPLIANVCDLIIAWQRRYEIAFGSNFYRSVYSDEIQRLTYDMADSERKSVSTDVKQALHRLHESWNVELEGDPFAPLAFITDVPSDFGTALRDIQGFVPGVDSAADDHDLQRAVGVFLWRFLRAREGLARLLERRLPTYKDLVRLTRYLVSDVEYFVSGATARRAAHDRLIQWCIAEGDIMRRFLDVLRENAYDIGPSVKADEMSVFKQRHNVIMDAVDALARHLGVANMTHLSERWTISDVPAGTSHV